MRINLLSFSWPRRIACSCSFAHEAVILLLLLLLLCQYRNPGSIQYEGPHSDAVTLTLALEQQHHRKQDEAAALPVKAKL